MKKSLSLILALSMALVGFTGCSNSSSTASTAAAAGGAASATSTAAAQSNGKLKVYGIYKAGDQTWFINEGAAAKKAVEAAGGEFIYVDAKMSPEEYLKAVDNAIANHASGVVTCVPDQTMSQSVVTKLTNAKIPVIAADDALQDTTGKKIAPWVGIDAYGIGAINGKWLADYVSKNNLTSKSDVGLLIMTMDTVSSCVPRAKGENDAFTKDCPSFNKSKIFKADYDGTTDKGNTAAAAVFTAHPEVKTWLVTGANEEGTVGACRALESAGLAKNACVVGLGGYLAKDEFKKASSPMKAATYFSSDSIGTSSIKVLQDAIAGKTVKQETTVSAVIVTPENYKQVMGAAAN